jgi:hypothetical protein
LILYESLIRDNSDPNPGARKLTEGSASYLHALSGGQLLLGRRPDRTIFFKTWRLKLHFFDIVRVLKRQFRSQSRSKEIDKRARFPVSTLSLAASFFFGGGQREQLFSILGGQPSSFWILYEYIRQSFSCRQCLGPGSTWILIDLALQDPDPYGECESGSAFPKRIRIN